MLNPVVLVPGIKGSGLENFYPLQTASTWSSFQAVAGTSLQNLQLAANGEVDEWDDIVNRPSQVLTPPYAAMVHGLRARLGVPVYVFPYDWRLSCAVNAERLVAFVEQLRKKPMRSVKGWADSDRLVNLVCHSMGGLVARAALGQWRSEHSTQAPVDSIVFLATPHLGSLDAVKAMIVGDTPILDFFKQLRKLARVLPSVYELLPRFDRALVDEEGRPLDIFKEKSWQSNVTTPAGDPENVTQKRLSAALAFLQALPHPTDEKCGVRGETLCIAGRKPDSTLVRVPVAKEMSGTRNVFLFGREHAILGDGDDVVPMESALLPGTQHCEIPFSDVGFWPSELGARVSFHGFFCSVDEVQTVVSRFLQRPKSKPARLLPLNLALGLGPTS